MRKSIVVFGIASLVYLAISFALVFGTDSLPFTPHKKNEPHVTEPLFASKNYSHMRVTARDGAS